MNSILYKEDEKLKMFRTDDFSFVFDKETGTSYTWGKTKSDAADFDIFSPETVEFVLDSSFKFDEYNFSSLMNINLKPGENFNEKYFLSTISNIELTIDAKDISNTEMKKLIDYLKSISVNVALRLKYNNDISFRELLKIKLTGVDVVIFDVNDITDEFIDAVKLFIAKNLFVNCNFYLNGKNVKKFKEMLDKLPILINGRLIYSTKYDDKIKEVIEKIKIDKRIGLAIKNNYKNIGNIITEIYDEYDAGLFSCVYDFVDKKIYPDKENKEKYSIDIENVKTINDYWYSTEFEKFRKSILKKIKTN